ncbi:MAG: hypothetical protein ACI9R3_004463 [Verrucomicrobiales bacterium]|jgi:hypothetical protein
MDDVNRSDRFDDQKEALVCFPFFFGSLSLFSFSYSERSEGEFF